MMMAFAVIFMRFILLIIGNNTYIINILSKKNYFWVNEFNPILYFPLCLIQASDLT